MKLHHSPALLCIEGNFHLFGGTNNSKHMQWNNKTQVFENMYDFDDVMDMTDVVAAYSKTKNIIICIGQRCDSIEGSVIYTSRIGSVNGQN